MMSYLLASSPHGNEQYIRAALFIEDASCHDPASAIRVGILAQPV
jgi:hypothetical protein